MDKNWITINRKIREWEWYKKPDMVLLFIDLLLSANFEDSKWEGQTIKRGQVVTGLKRLHKNTGISVQSLRTCLNRLKSTGEITSTSTNKYRIITIVKYNEYQLDKEKLTSTSTNNQQTTNKQLTSSNNSNKNNDVNNISKDIQATPEYGNSLINKSIKFLEQQLGGSLDGSKQINRNYANLLINRFKKDYPNQDTYSLIESLIKIGLIDDFHSKNINGFKYLYYNAQKIIQTAKNSNQSNKYKPQTI